MNINPLIYKLLLAALMLCFLQVSSAQSYMLPDPNSKDTMVGKAIEIKSRPGDTLRLIGRRYDMGTTEMQHANQGINPDMRLLPGTRVIVPSLFILPERKNWKGIYVNLNSYRLFYFPADLNIVITYPIGIGKEGMNTPTFNGFITKKVQDPWWYVPTSVSERTLKNNGIQLPKIMPPEPDNPLGQYKIYTSNPGYLMHGTNRPLMVGAQVSSGCLRILPEDIEQIYELIPLNTPISVNHEPNAVGILGGHLYFQSFLPLSGYDESGAGSTTPAVNEILLFAKEYGYNVQWDVVSQVLEKKGSIPTRISVNQRTRKT
jgi:L,D-transpeptidase ErfK/SrfK